MKYALVVAAVTAVFVGAGAGAAAGTSNHDGDPELCLLDPEPGC
jgi:hypothetical protein